MFILICSLGLHCPVIGQNFATVETYAGNGTPGLTNGPLATSQLHAPYDIAYDDVNDVVFVADALNHCIRIIESGQVSILAGNGSPGDIDGQGLNARFNLPTGVCAHDGYVYVCDAGNNKVKRVDLLGNVETVAGTGLAGCADGNVMAAEFNNPVGLILDPVGIIYVADYGNGAIRKIDGSTVSTTAGACGSPGDAIGSTADARFDHPSDLAIDSAGDIYVMDQSNNKIKLISGGQVTLVAGSGLQASIDGTGALAAFAGPAFGDLLTNGVLLVTDWISNTIRSVTASGSVSTVAGTGAAGYVDGPVVSAMFNVPYGICHTSGGAVLVSDRSNNVLRRLLPQDWQTSTGAAISNTQPVHCFWSDGLIHITGMKADDPATVLRILDARGGLLLATVFFSATTRSGDEIIVEIGDLSAGCYQVVFSTAEGVEHSTIFVD